MVKYTYKSGFLYKNSPESIELIYIRVYTEGMKKYINKKIPSNEQILTGETFEWVRISPIEHLSELTLFGFKRVKSAIPLVQHIHPNEFEIIYMEKGRMSWEIGSQVVETQANDLLLTRPGDIHRGQNNLIQPCRFWWLIVSIPADKEEWLGLHPSEAEVILKELQLLPSKLKAPENLLYNLQRLKSCIESSEMIGSIYKRVILLDLLLQMIQCSQNKSNVQATPMDAVLAEMDRRINERPSIAELAQLIWVSPSHLHKMFRELKGIAPIAYMDKLRIEKAASCIERTKDSITQIAFQFGYTSSQSFATIFRRYYGCSPLEWRSKRQSVQER